LFKKNFSRNPQVLVTGAEWHCVLWEDIHNAIWVTLLFGIALIGIA
jgi:hypothetical protein